MMLRQNLFPFIVIATSSAGKELFNLPEKSFVLNL